MNKVVVFGGSGFLGSHIADALTVKGFRVVIFDIVSSKYLNRDQEMIVGNILDHAAVKRAVKGASYVFHFAGIAGIEEAHDSPYDTAHINILSTINILEACKEYRVKRFVYASTIYVYSSHGSFYRCSKQACELFIENYHEEFGLDFIILRFGSLYGKRANEFNFIYQAIKEAITENRISRPGNGDEIRDYINVLDAAKVSTDILEKEEFKNSHLMVKGTQTTKVHDLLLMIKEMLNESVEIIYNDKQIKGHYKMTPYSFRPKVAKQYVLDTYYDLGQGLLDCIYDVYDQIKQDHEPPTLDSMD